MVLDTTSNDRLDVLFTMRDLGPLKKHMIKQGVGIWTYYVITGMYLPRTARCRLKSLRIDDSDCAQSLIKYVRLHRPRCCVPLDYTDAYMVATLAPQLEALGCRTLLASDPHLYLDMENKAVTAQFLQREGLPHPETWIYPKLRDLPDPTPDEPMYVKLCTGTNGGAGVVKVESRLALERQLQIWGSQCVVQQREDPGSHAEIDGIYINGELIAAHFARSRMMTNGRSKTWRFAMGGDDVTHVPLSYDTINRIMPLCIKLGRTLQWSGPINIEFLVSDHAVQVLEFNPRFGGGLHHAVKGPLFSTLFDVLLNTNDSIPTEPYFVTDWTPCSLKETRLAQFYARRLGSLLLLELPTRTVRIERRIVATSVVVALVLFVMLVIVIKRHIKGRT